MTLIILSCAIASYGQESYDYNVHVSADGDSLRYRYLEPENRSENRKYPLVIFLHGAGERGNDNIKQLMHGSQMFLNPVNQEKYPAYVIFPQCPEEQYWAFNKRPDSFLNLKAEEEITPILKAVKELIDVYLTNPSVDRSRIYIMGLSMGGMATFDIVSRFPEIFAAAIPICGIADTERVTKAKDVNWRIYHGDADNIVPVECSRKAYTALKEAKANVEYFEFPGCNHASWNPAFNQPDFMKWLFTQKKRK